MEIKGSWRKLHSYQTKWSLKKSCNKRERRELYNDKRVNTARRDKIYKCICTQWRSTRYTKASISGHAKQLIKGNTIIAGDFNTSLTSVGRSSRQKINTETLNLNNAFNQMDLINIYKYRTFHPKAEYTLF